jgi:hypothetical protein
MKQKRCEEIEPWIMGLHDGALAPEQVQEVEAHLSVCTACTDRLREVQRVGSLIRETLREEAAGERFVGFVEAVKDRIGLKVPGKAILIRPRLKHLLFPSAVTVGALALAMLFILWLIPWEKRLIHSPEQTTGLQVIQAEMGRLQGQLGLGIRNYASLQFALAQEEMAFQRELSLLLGSSSFYKDRGGYQETLGRMIRDYAFVRYYAERWGGRGQERIGMGIRDVAQLNFNLRSKPLRNL